MRSFVLSVLLFSLALSGCKSDPGGGRTGLQIDELQAVAVRDALTLVLNFANLPIDPPVEVDLNAPVPVINSGTVTINLKDGSATVALDGLPSRNCMPSQSTLDKLESFVSTASFHPIKYGYCVEMLLIGPTYSWTFNFPNDFSISLYDCPQHFQLSTQEDEQGLQDVMEAYKVDCGGIDFAL